MPQDNGFIRLPMRWSETGGIFQWGITTATGEDGLSIDAVGEMEQVFFSAAMIGDEKVKPVGHSRRSVVYDVPKGAELRWIMVGTAVSKQGSEVGSHLETERH